jgi:hypothetical protein
VNGAQQSFACDAYVSSFWAFIFGLSFLNSKALNFDECVRGFSQPVGSSIVSQGCAPPAHAS